jgi:hypothetical protein
MEEKDSCYLLDSKHTEARFSKAKVLEILASRIGFKERF